MNQSANPDCALTAVVLNLLIPLMLTAGARDPDHARQAAIEAIDCQIRAGRTGILEIGQIIALSVTAMDSLRLAIGTAVPTDTKVKLCNSARALNRQAENLAGSFGRTPNRSRRSEPLPVETVAVDTPADTAEASEALGALDVLKSELARPETAARAKAEHRPAWANAMTDVAAECARNLHTLPPLERRMEITRIAALTDAARELLQPQDLRRSSTDTPSKTAVTAPTTTLPRA